MKQTFYTRYGKRLFDIVCALAGLVLFCWLYAILALVVRWKLGSPVIFCQERPGKNEKIFKLYKFRSMTDARDIHGNLLPDDARLPRFGRLLRSTSLDELPELWNILRGDMSVVGPRPLLPGDVAYMDATQHRRHELRPGLTGLAQVSGRNALDWDTKLALDVEYVDHCTFAYDISILLRTVGKVFAREDVAFDNPEYDVDLKVWNERKRQDAKKEKV